MSPTASAQRTHSMFEKRSDLLKFLAVIETGKIQLAAEKMNTTQPALSRIIAKLEEQFSGQLFERIPSGVRLTPFGSTIADQVRHIVREIELAEGEIASSASGRTGALRISAGPMWMRAYFPIVIRKFHDIYPGIQLQLRTRSYSDAMEDLINGVSDLHCGGFDNDLPLPQFLKRECMMSMKLGVVANAAHPIFYKNKPTYDDLAEYPWLAYMGENALVGKNALFTTDDNDIPLVNTVLEELYEKCGKRVSSIVRCDISGLFLMGTAPYLSYLAVLNASNFAGQQLREVPLDFTPRHIEAGIVARRSIESTSAFLEFKSILEAEVELHT